jgi:hypothetical protein
VAFHLNLESPFTDHLLQISLSIFYAQRIVLHAHASKQSQSLGSHSSYSLVGKSNNQITTQINV